MAVPRVSATGGRTDRRPQRRWHAVGSGGSPRRCTRRPQALAQERCGQFPDAFVQGSRRLGGAQQGPRVRHDDRRLCQHGQPGEQRGSPSRECGPRYVHPRSRRPRTHENPRHRHIRRESHRLRGYLRRSQSPLYADRHEVRLGLRERQFTAVLCRGIQNDGLRDRPRSRLAVPAARRRTDGGRRAHRQDPQGVPRTLHDGNREHARDDENVRGTGVRVQPDQRCGEAEPRKASPDSQAEHDLQEPRDRRPCRRHFRSETRPRNRRLGRRCRRR